MRRKFGSDFREIVRMRFVLLYEGPGLSDVKILIR